MVLLNCSCHQNFPNPCMRSSCALQLCSQLSKVRPSEVLQVVEAVSPQMQSQLALGLHALCAVQAGSTPDGPVNGCCPIPGDCQALPLNHRFTVLLPAASHPHLAGLQVIEVSGALAELRVAQELRALRAAQNSKAVPRLVGSYRVGKLHYIVTT